MEHHIVLRVVAKFLIPLIMLFGLYVQFHGDFGPGGGFQAGVIFAAAIILYAIVFGLDQAMLVIPPRVITKFIAVGLSWKSKQDLFMLGVFIGLELVEEFLEQFLSRPQPGVDDLDVLARLLAGEPDQLFGEIGDLDGLAHVQHVDFTPAAQHRRLHNQLAGLRDRHEIARNLGVRHRDRARHRLHGNRAWSRRQRSDHDPGPTAVPRAL